MHVLQNMPIKSVFQKSGNIFDCYKKEKMYINADKCFVEYAE